MTTIEARNGAVTEIYTVSADGLGVWIEHVSVSADGDARLSGMASLMIDPSVAGAVASAVQRAVREFVSQ